MAQAIHNVDYAQQAAAKRARMMRGAIATVARYGVLTLGSIVIIVPFLFQISTSLKDTGQLLQVPAPLIPNPLHWETYQQAYTALPFNTFFLNTVLIEVGVLAGTLLSSTVVAYAFARLNAPFKNALFVIVLSTMMLPGIITLVPTYFIWKNFHLVDTLWPLIIPAWFGGGAFNIFLLRQFFLGVPGELGEAATIDGASLLGVMFRIYVPLAKPAVAAVAIMTFIGTWHDFFGPLIYLNSQTHFTLALGINEYISANTQPGQAVPWNLVMAASMSIIVPPLLLFLFFQRFFIEGIMLGGVKG